MFNETLNPLAAFAGGFATFFASCLLPMVPTYLAYLMGNATTIDSSTNKSKLLKTAFVFVLGFSLTFIVFGLSLNTFAATLTYYRTYLEKLGGLMFMIFGAFLLGLGQQSFLQREWKIPDLSSRFKNWHYVHAFVFGVVFAAGWTPCIGPMLAVILLWSANQETIGHGLTLLVSFSAGLGFPFILTALAFEKIMPWWQKSQRYSQIVRKISGTIVLVTGFFLFIGYWQSISLWALRLLPLSQFTP